MRRRGTAVLVAAIVVAGAALLVGASLQDTLVYYRTPSEVTDTPPPGDERFRLGGQVATGSVSQDGEVTRFRLTDGRDEVVVIQRGSIPGTFREGQGAVVEGVLDARGDFHSDTLTVKHSNEYRAPEDERADVG